MLPIPSPGPNVRPQGVLIIGTSGKCGKTVLAAGLAGSLNESGLRTEALKPLVFKSSQCLKPDLDQAYLDQLTGQAEKFTPIQLASAHEMTPVLWRRFLELCRRPMFPAFIEMPGSVATPLMFNQENIMDAADVAHLLELPVILATTKQAGMMDEMLPALMYLQKRKVELSGWVAVECLSVPAPYWDEEVFYITQTHGCPYLGEIGYSPSISVELRRPGNLIPQTQQGVDLLPLQIAMKLSVP